MLLVNSSTDRRNSWPFRAVDRVNGSGLSLLSTGSLVYGDFQSFYFPSDTILPGQNINGTVLISKNGKFMFDSRKLFLNSIYCAMDFDVTMLRKLSLDDDGNLRLYSFDFGSRQWLLGWQAVYYSRNLW
ncbi:uncharacterized protein [Primulina eburnea]|uniref:uncharacterized protein n=1 Tax=Primulina eburnea TaxID=1245227 RepID=UPI003C6C4F4B